MNMKIVPTRTMLILILVLAGTASVSVAEKSGKSKIASLRIGEGGKLEYIPDDKGNLIPDFSRAGYMGGGVKIPDVPVKITLEPSNDETTDDSPRIEKALAELAAMPVGKDGFRGALLLKEGIYRISRAIPLSHSGVVLRGEGQGRDGTIVVCGPTQRATGSLTKKRMALKIAPTDAKAKKPPIVGIKRKVLGSYVPFGIHTITLESAKGFSVGDKVMLRRPGTQAWIDAIGMRRFWGTRVHIGNLRYERVITKIEGDRVTLDAPLMNSLDERFGGGTLEQYAAQNRISHVGVEYLRFTTQNIAAAKKLVRPMHGIVTDKVENGWICNVTLTAFETGFNLATGTKYFTEQDVIYDGQQDGVRANKPSKLYGQYILVQRLYTPRGRRALVSTGSGVTGPNVCLDCQIDKATGTSGPHGYWVTGGLYDCIHGGMVRGGLNNHSKGSGQGWTSGQHVLWNCFWSGGPRGQAPKTSILVPSLVPAPKEGGRNYKFGYKKQVTPRSLYIQQLEDRLGKEAVLNVTTEAQRNGTIHQELLKNYARLESDLGVKKDKESGKLTYVTYGKGNRIPDFSHVGYEGGDVKIPDVPARKTLQPTTGAGDDAARIQKAIDDVSGLEPDPNGFRGAVLLKRGTYRVSGPLHIRSSGVVLRGEGQTPDGTVIQADFKSSKGGALIQIQGDKKGIVTCEDLPDSRLKVADSYVPLGATSFNLESTDGLSKGDRVILCRPGTKEWINAVGVNLVEKKTVWKPENFHMFYERVITGIQGKTITIDVPVVEPMNARYGGGFVVPYAPEGRVAHVGLEQIRLAAQSGKGKGATGVLVKSAEDGWVRNVSTHGFHDGVDLGAGTRSLTIRNVAFLSAPDKTGYGVQISGGQLHLVQRCFTERGVQAQVTGRKVPGPNVFVECLAPGGSTHWKRYEPLEPGIPQHRWATGVLYDNVIKMNKPDPRKTFFSPIFRTGTGQVFWNCEGIFGLYNASLEMNRDFGTFRPDNRRGRGRHVDDPKSLYVQQLEDRLGKEAARGLQAGLLTREKLAEKPAETPK